MQNVTNMENVVREIDESDVLTGSQAIHMDAGYIVKVVHAPSWPKELGKYLIKTNNDEYPFVSLKDGKVWGNSIEDCKFEVIKTSIQIN